MRYTSGRSPPLRVGAMSLKRGLRGSWSRAEQKNGGAQDAVSHEAGASLCPRAGMS